MIIPCNNCNKKFDIESALIPEKGRLLQCNSCNYKWFFKKESIDKSISTVKIGSPADEQRPLKEEVILAETKSLKSVELLKEVTDDVSLIEKFSKNKYKNDEVNEDNKEEKVKKTKNIKNYNILNLIIVFIISIIALIIVFDTLQKPISYIIPNIEFLLYSLYESIHDLLLFLRDLA